MALDSSIAVDGKTVIHLVDERTAPPREPFAIAADGVARIEAWHLSPFF